MLGSRTSRLGAGRAGSGAADRFPRSGDALDWFVPIGLSKLRIRGVPQDRKRCDGNDSSTAVRYLRDCERG